MSNPAPALLDSFVPVFAVRERHEVTVQAPAAIVMRVARNFDIESIWLVRTLFKIRATLLGAQSKQEQRAGLVQRMQSIGWGCLAQDPQRYFIAGAACRPWDGDPGFTPIPPDQFAAFAEPNQVKIAWTLEAHTLAPNQTRFASETRVAPTDKAAQIKFRRYWRKFGLGIILIRLVLLPAVRRQAEREAQAR